LYAFVFGFEQFKGMNVVALKQLAKDRPIRVEIRFEDVDPVCFNANASMFD